MPLRVFVRFLGFWDLLGGRLFDLCMKYRPEYQHRRSIRLQSHDYASPGNYFITVCTYERELMFGVIDEGEMYLNEWGTIVDKSWQALDHYFSHIHLSSWVVMPNHVHGIICIDQFPESHFKIDRKFSDAVPGSISTIVGSFKSATTRKINQVRQNSGATIWQKTIMNTLFVMKFLELRFKIILLKIQKFGETIDFIWGDTIGFVV